MPQAGALFKTERELSRGGAEGEKRVTKPAAPGRPSRRARDHALFVVVNHSLSVRRLIGSGSLARGTLDPRGASAVHFRAPPPGRAHMTEEAKVWRC